MSEIYQNATPLSIQVSTHQHVHIRKPLEDEKGHLEKIERNSSQNSPRPEIVPIPIVRVENLIAREPLTRTLKQVLPQ